MSERVLRGSVRQNNSCEFVLASLNTLEQTLNQRVEARSSSIVVNDNDLDSSNCDKKEHNLDPKSAKTTNGELKQLEGHYDIVSSAMTAVANNYLSNSPVIKDILQKVTIVNALLRILAGEKPKDTFSGRKWENLKLRNENIRQSLASFDRLYRSNGSTRVG